MQGGVTMQLVCAMTMQVPWNEDAGWYDGTGCCDAVGVIQGAMLVQVM